MPARPQNLVKNDFKKKANRHPQKQTDLRMARVEEFLRARSLSSNSQKAYRRELKRFINWSNKPLNQITPRQIVQYKEYLQGESLAASSINRALCAVKSFFAWLEETYQTQNPTVSVALNKLPSLPAFDLSDKEIEALQLVLPQRPEVMRKRDAAIIAVLRHGLRACEVVALNLGDYDGVRVHVRVGKDDSGGTVPLDATARAAINAYLQQRREKGEKFSATAPMFASHSPVPGKPTRLGYQGLYYLIKELGSNAGIENLTPHRLRHTFATNLLLKGMDSLHARTLTRHKSEVSFKRYAKRALSAAAERAFYEAIGEEPP
ncbi:integrase domain protein SAM domain protein (plasmid) [Gloeothece citriformis PCC 7424]|uniref:Integrase domain protein SAM domain protein n=1 Tax=Gloeothece citriformis (strain PCC 7424) TaxID=65393 RepID=B7KLV0_GLOC7|nr:tyrosine-type recombinase/integrase [Gloeothece citriformis]ACK73772.1 integrase domain protein SAM domain protein [Gloeothece citriformis PCC 7424]